MRNAPVLTLIVMTSLIRFTFAAATGLGVDESYMIAAGRHWALGYFDHPLASWWLSHGAAVLLGSEAPAIVRLPFILLFALSQVLVWRIGCRTGGVRAGFWATVALNLSPVFGLTTGSWVLPDGPLDAALLAAALCLINALAAQEKALTDPTERPRTGRAGIAWWMLAGVAAGMALLSKYSAVLVIGGAFLYLLTSPRHRLCLLRPGPYAALLAALMIFSPVLIWNAAHGWASFAFQGDRALGLRFHPLGPLTTLGGEALFVLPWFWLPMMVLLVHAFRGSAPWTDRLLAWLALPPIAGFALISLWSSQRILFHWAAPGYLMLFPLLGRAIAERTGDRRVRRTLAATAALLLAAMLVIATQVQFDWLGGSLTGILKKDPTVEGLDWTSVRDDLAARGLLAHGRPVAALNWRDCGKFGYALGPGTPMLCLTADAREFGFARPPGRFAGDDVLLLAVNPAPQARREAERWFGSVETLPPAEIRLHGRVLATVSVMLGHDLRVPSGP